MKKEKEIKVKIKSVGDAIKVKNLLDRKYGKSVVEIQKTYFFSNVGKKDHFLRVREENDNAKVTLKIKRKIRKDVFERDEYEIELKDKSQVKGMIEIFSKLGLSGIRILEKNRMTWHGGGTIVALDELSFGLFLEIEGSSKDKIQRVVKELDLCGNDTASVSYWDLYDDYRRSKNIVSKDCLLRKQRLV